MNKKEGNETLRKTSNQNESNQNKLNAYLDDLNTKQQQQQHNKRENLSRYTTSTNTASTNTALTTKEKRISSADKHESTHHSSDPPHETSKLNKKVQTTSIKTESVFEKGSPLFLKIMSKLSEIPDLSKKMCDESERDENRVSKLRTESVTPTGTISGATSGIASGTTSGIASGTILATMSNELQPAVEFKSLKSDANSNVNKQSSANVQSLPAIKMSDKKIKALNKTNIVIVRRPTQPAPTPVCSTSMPRPAATRSMRQSCDVEKQISQNGLADKDTLSFYSNADYSSKPLSSMNTSVNSNFSIKQEDLFTLKEPKSNDTTLIDNLNNKYSSNRYTSIIETKESPADKNKVDDSLKKIFTYLDSLDEKTQRSNQAAEAAKPSVTPIETKKYFTINPSTFNTSLKKETEEVKANKNLNDLKFATTNPNDFKTKINEAFLSLTENKSKLKPNADSQNVTAGKLKEPINFEEIIRDLFPHKMIKSSKPPDKPPAMPKPTEEIEKAADFSLSSNDSLSRTTTSFGVATNKKSTSPPPSTSKNILKDSGIVENFNQLFPKKELTSINTAKVVNNYTTSNATNPIHKIQIRLKRDESQPRSLAEEKVIDKIFFDNF